MGLMSRLARPRTRTQSRFVIAWITFLKKDVGNRDPYEMYLR